jgi:hypothetical protein
MFQVAMEKFLLSHGRGDTNVADKVVINKLAKLIINQNNQWPN